VAYNDSYSTNKNVTLTVAASGVLANDSDPNLDPITAVLASGPSHGTLTLHPNGSFTYAPAHNFSGTDTFTYRAMDSGGLLSNVATVTIAVNKHFRGDGDDHDRHRNGHHEGDGCEHDREAHQ
jgi:VCBS repeat-containing protein